MRGLLLVIVLSISLTPIAAAQRGPKPVYYFDVGGNVGTPHAYGLRLRLATVIAKHHEIGVGYQAFIQRGRNFPEDFWCGTCVHNLRKDLLSAAAISYGYIVYPKFFPKKLRIVLRAEALVGEEFVAVNFRKVPGAGPEADNYTYDKDRRVTAALLLRPTIAILTVPALGVSVGPYALLSRHFSGGGLSVGLLLGRVYRRPVQEDGVPDEPAQR
jgi:hypothetical protein